MSHAFYLFNTVSSGYNSNLSWSTNVPFQLLGLCQTFLQQQLNESHAETSYPNSINHWIKQRVQYGKYKEATLNIISFTLIEMLSFIKDIKITTMIFAGK